MALKGEKRAASKEGGKIKTPNAEPKTSGPAGGWFAALSLEGSYSKPPNDEDLSFLAKAKARLRSSDIPEVRKRQILGYIRLGEEIKGGRFSVVQAEAVVNDYLDGKATDENLDFEIRLMEAWCGGKMKEFMKIEGASLLSRELPVEEKAMLERMLLLAESASPVLCVLSVSALRVYYPMSGEKSRLQVLRDAIDVMESARSPESPF